MQKHKDAGGPESHLQVMLLEFEMSGRETGQNLGRSDGAYYSDERGIFRSLGGERARSSRSSQCQSSSARPVDGKKGGYPVMFSSVF